MGQMRVWNLNDYELKERFNGREVIIPPKKFVVMESDEAYNYRGQYYPMVKTADGQGDKRFFKILKLEPIGEETAAKDLSLMCHVCKIQHDTDETLAAHMKLHEDLLLKDEPEAAHRRGPGRPPKTV